MEEEFRERERERERCYCAEDPVNGTHGLCLCVGMLSDDEHSSQSVDRRCWD